MTTDKGSDPPPLAPALYNQLGTSVDANGIPYPELTAAPDTASLTVYKNGQWRGTAFAKLDVEDGFCWCVEMFDVDDQVRIVARPPPTTGAVAGPSSSPTVQQYQRDAFPAVRDGAMGRIGRTSGR